MTRYLRWRICSSISGSIEVDYFLIPAISGSRVCSIALYSSRSRAGIPVEPVKLCDIRLWLIFASLIQVVLRACEETNLNFTDVEQDVVQPTDSADHHSSQGRYIPGTRTTDIKHQRLSRDPRHRPNNRTFCPIFSN